MSKYLRVIWYESNTYVYLIWIDCTTAALTLLSQHMTNASLLSKCTYVNTSVAQLTSGKMWKHSKLISGLQFYAEYLTLAAMTSFIDR